MDTETLRLVKRGIPLYTALAIALLVLSVASILYLGREIFMPVALAVLLSFVLAPAVRLLQRAAVPQALAVMLTVLIAFGAIAAIAGVMGSQIAGLGADVPKYQTTIRTKLMALGGESGGSGSLGRAIGAFGSIGRDLRRMVAGTPAGESETAGPKPMPVVVENDGTLLDSLGGFVSPLLHPLATGFVVLILSIFVLASREDLRNRFVRLVGTDDIQHTTAVIDDAAARLSRLFLMQLAVNSAFGLVISLGLWAIGIPSPFLWGILAGVLRFVPYVGAVVGLVPPLLLAFAVDPGWSMLAWTFALFFIVEPAVGHGLEPLLFGHSTGISPVAVILSATVWTFLWGPVGLVLATPITVCLVVLGRHVGRLEFIGIMLGDQPALSPQQIFYQRMLAGDPSEAVLQAQDFLRERALSTYYDEVALAALRLAHEDVARGRLTPERQEILRRSMETLVQRLDASVRDPRPKGGRQVSAETAAAVSAVGPDRGAATRVVAPDELRPDWRGDVPVVCLARPGTLDEIVAQMLTQVLTKHGIPARTIASTHRQGDDPATDADAKGVRLVCLSYLEPLSTLHLRHAVRVARRCCSGSQVIVGIWRERDAGAGRLLGRSARADAVAPTIGVALAAIVAAAVEPPRTGRSIPAAAPQIGRALTPAAVT